MSEQSEPLVGILMGSDSDLAVMRKAADVLDEFGVSHELLVLSAHRSADRAAEYARTAHERGRRIIIAGAGMAAHLAGAMAAHTRLPVIGVPLASSSGLGGADALYSTVQMPPGVPVATVAIGGAKNAAYLAVRILALGDSSLGEKLDRAREEMDRASGYKSDRIRELGVDGYLRERST